MSNWWHSIGMVAGSVAGLGVIAGLPSADVKVAASPAALGLLGLTGLAMAYAVVAGTWMVERRDIEAEESTFMPPRDVLGSLVGALAALTGSPGLVLVTTAFALVFPLSVYVHYFVVQLVGTHSGVGSGLGGSLESTLLPLSVYLLARLTGARIARKLSVGFGNERAQLVVGTLIVVLPPLLLATSISPDALDGRAGASPPGAWLVVVCFGVSKLGYELIVPLYKSITNELYHGEDRATLLSAQTAVTSLSAFVAAVLGYVLHSFTHGLAEVDGGQHAWDVVQVSALLGLLAVPFWVFAVGRYRMAAPNEAAAVAGGTGA